MKFLIENTWVPISTAITIIGGGAVWLTLLFSETRANTIKIDALDKKQDFYVVHLQSIKGDLEYIKGKLETMEGNKK